MEYSIHESSFVDKNVRIGKGTKIWHFSHILSNVSIGKNCIIGQNVCVGPNVKIGNNVKIQNNVSVYEGVTLEDDVFCGPSMVFTNVNIPRSAHPKKKSEYKKTLVQKGTTIGANSTIVCGITLGKHCLVGAGSVVTRDVPGHAMVYGVPAKIQGWVCECGNKIVFNEKKTTCNKCGKTYKKINKQTIEFIG
ncbi:N-acetyltransferase [candidate division WOR-3 bacterium]|nr:N-acetyltransferase [candidate division WOR-3 bacterium]